MAKMDPSRLQKIKKAKIAKTQKRKEALKTSHVEEVLREKRQAVSTSIRASDKTEVTSTNLSAGSADLVGSFMHRGEKALPLKRVRSEGGCRKPLKDFSIRVF